MIVNIFSLQAAIHYHLPYSSLYGRINRLKREQATEWAAFRDYEDPELEDTESSNGLEFSNFLSSGPEYEENCEAEGGVGPSAAALLQSLASQGANM